MSDRSPIPNLPPLSGVQDPAVRAYLEALSQGWLVRNGQTRNTDERFLTTKDLTDGIATVVRSGGAGGTITMGGGSLAETITNAIGSLVSSIRESRLNKLLEERIARIEMPEWFRGKFGAEVQTVIAQEQNARSAMVAEVKTAVSNIAGNVAIAQQTIKTTSSVVNATAEAVTSLQTEVGGLRVNAEEALRLAQNVEGDVSGSWTVKFDANGYVTGAGLGLEGKGGNYTSEFIVRADRFSIGAAVNPAAMADPAFPFIVTTTDVTIGDVTYPPGAWIKSAYIAEASIGTLHLKNGGVGLVAHAGGAGFSQTVSVSIPKNCHYFVLLVAVSSAYTTGAPSSYYETNATVSCAVNDNVGGSVVTGNGHGRLMYGSPIYPVTCTIAREGWSGGAGCTVTGTADFTPTTLPYGVSIGADTYASLIGIYQ